MSASYAISIPLGACVLAAALEGVCAGKNIKSFFAKLRFPSYSAPLWVWYIIGGLYYATFFFVLYRVLRHEADSVLRNATLTVILFMMLVNALWKYVFFRAQNLFISLVATAFFPVMDLALLICLIQLDKLATWALVPYLLYRLYSLSWAYGLWKMN